MDAFDIFDADDDVPAAPPPLLPRASTHPHFSHWAILQGSSSLAEASSSLRSCLADRAESCARGLKKSRSQYGRDCARSLLDAWTPLREDISDEALTHDDVRRHAQACADLCATAIEESNWDVAAWQEANLLALSVLLASSLSRGDPAEPIGKVAIALLNLACSSASPLPPGQTPQWMPPVHRLLGCAEAAVAAAYPAASVESGVWEIPTSPPRHGRTPSLDPTKRVREVDASGLSCAAFFDKYLQRGEPVLIRGHLKAEGWGALEYFRDLRRLHADAGERLVPVSLGSPLVGYGGVVHWPLRRLIEQHLLPSNATHETPPASGSAPDEEGHCRVAYMTQHHLLHQQPALQALLAVPPYTLGRELSPTNVWIGTRGTVTSLHSDPSDNLLCQVAGYKYFRLYALDQTPKIYATTQRANNTNSFGTSPVRVEAPIPPEHAAAADAVYVEGVLAPGDMLFLPKGMWHYVRSLTTSVSVNFWY